MLEDKIIIRSGGYGRCRSMNGTFVGHHAVSERPEIVFELAREMGWPVKQTGWSHDGKMFDTYPDEWTITLPKGQGEEMLRLFS